MRLSARAVATEPQRVFTDGLRLLRGPLVPLWSMLASQGMSEAPFPRVHATQVAQLSVAPWATRVTITSGLQMPTSARALKIVSAMLHVRVIGK
eukprot:2559082-Lingulodinium_polyedra.AAC.1